MKFSQHSPNDLGRRVRQEARMASDLGGRSWFRTSDPSLVRRTLSQLSYAPTQVNAIFPQVEAFPAVHDRTNSCGADADRLPFLSHTTILVGGAS